MDTTSAFLSKTFDVGDLPLPTFRNCVLKTGVIKRPLRQYVRFYVFFSKSKNVTLLFSTCCTRFFEHWTCSPLLLRRRAAAAQSVQQSIDISCRPGPQQQTRRTLLRRSITGADTVTADRPCRILHASRQWCIGGVYVGIRRIPTSGVFWTAYIHLDSDHK